MSSKMHVVTRNLCLTLVAMFSVTAAGMCAAAIASATPETPVPVAPQQPAEEVEVIDEIWVRGKHLSEVIEDAEDDFFKLYNKLNKNGEFDVFCGMMSLNPGSMIMVRKCVPGFVVYRNYNPVTNMVSYSTGSFDSGCSGLAFGSCSSSQTFSSYSTATGYSVSSGISDRSGYSYPGAGPLLESRSLEYGDNVLKVVTSDSRLLEMVRNLGGLYDEMESLQDRFTTLKEAGQVRQTRKSGKHYISPRTL